jgi:hypothetical protein
MKQAGLVLIEIAAYRRFALMGRCWKSHEKQSHERQKTESQTINKTKQQNTKTNKVTKVNKNKRDKTASPEFLFCFESRKGYWIVFREVVSAEPQTTSLQRQPIRLRCPFLPVKANALDRVRSDAPRPDIWPIGQTAARRSLLCAFGSWSIHQNWERVVRKYSASPTASAVGRPRESAGNSPTKNKVKCSCINRQRTMKLHLTVNLPENKKRN